MPFTSLLASGLLVDPTISHEDVQVQTISPAQAPHSGLYNVLSTRSSDLQGAASFNATAVLAGQQSHTVALVTIVTSSVSFTTTLFAIYWFFMMRRNFRRSLVALLIVADLVKSLCLVVQSATAISPGGLHTSSALCQVTGYVFLTSSESCDITVFLMSLHMVLQIFPSPRLANLGHDGLYHIRGWVYAAWFIVPNIMGALAFVDTNQGYAAIGPVCALPIRPFWYRLALSWIPRYLVMIYICYVALRIYNHVGKEFKVFGQVDNESNSLDMPGESSCVRADANVAMTMRSMNTTNGIEGELPVEKRETRTTPRRFSVPMLQRSRGAKKQQTATDLSNDHPSSAVTGSLPESRRPSLIAWTDFSMAQSQPHAASLPSSRRGSRQWPMNEAEVTPRITSTEQKPMPSESRNLAGRQNSGDTLASLRSPGHPRQNSGMTAATQIPESRLSARAHLANAQQTALDLIQGRRRAIQRQLRILFIYPVVYILLWIFPLVAHCLSYSDRFAQHPVFAISILNLFCQSFLGCADVLVFSWREKPWRHIPGSDGSFKGSFFFWTFYHVDIQDDYVEPSIKQPLPDAANTPLRPDSRPTHSRSGLLASVKHWSLPLTSSSSSSSASPPTTHLSVPPHARTSTNPASRFARGAARPSRTSASDRTQLERDRVHERRALERQQHARAAELRAQTLSASSFSSSTPGVTTSAASFAAPRERREWWDGGAFGGRDLFRDDDDDDDDDAHNDPDDDDVDDENDEDRKMGRESACTEKSSSRATSGATTAEEEQGLEQELEQEKGKEGGGERRNETHGPGPGGGGGGGEATGEAEGHGVSEKG